MRNNEIEIHSCLTGLEFCEECGGLFTKEKMSQVEFIDELPFPQHSMLFYCETHKKPYSKKTRFYVSNDVKDPHVYEKQFRVDKNGDPIGYKKITK